MCCRYDFGTLIPDDRIHKLVELMDRDFPGQYKTGEIFPGDPAPALIGESGRMRHTPAFFGFPTASGGRLLLNARSETVSQKQTFAEAWRMRRAVLPATGFYEWGKDEKKTKYLFTGDADRAVYLCGLWRAFEKGICFVILTRPAQGAMEGVHDRMPVIAAAEDVRAYVTEFSAADRLIAAPPPPLFRMPVE